ncbi:MAG: glycosyltransferase family 2 protein, partial [Patescibacteria group bacterium]
MKPLLSVCIVHWNTPHALNRLLSALETAQTDWLEAIVVDNASSNPIHNLLKRFPAVKLIQNKHNFGYAHACNQATATGVGEWLIFLNPDVEISPIQLTALLTYAQTHQLDALSPMPANQGYALPLPSPTRFWLEYSPLKVFQPLWRLFSMKRTLTGGCLLIRRQVLLDLGGWDERFFLWFEDSDLTQRLYQNSYQVGWYPQAIAHQGGLSVKKLADQTQKDLFFTSALIYAQKHFSRLGQLATAMLVKRFTKRVTLPILSDQTDRTVHNFKCQLPMSLVVPNLKLSQLKLFFANNWQFLSADVIGGKVELIVVSSALIASDLQFWSKKYPLTKFVIIKKNRGFASTVNIGFRASSGKWLGTVNDDVTLSSKWLDKLLAVASNNPKTGSINPIIKNTHGEIESAGIKILPQGKALPITQICKNTAGEIESVGIKIRDRSKAQPITQICKETSIGKQPISHPTTTSVDATNAACVLYSRPALDQVGLFDERFGSYLEDIDLSLRLTRAGWQN